MSATFSLKLGRLRSRLLFYLLLLSLSLWLFTAVSTSKGAADTQFIKHSIDDNFAYVEDIQLADMDGDDDPDVIAATPVTGASGLSWWENESGDGTFWFEHIVCPGDRGAYTAVPVDLDGDGDIDILASLTGEDDIMWFENLDGAATSWTEHRILSHEFDDDKLLAVDMDGDNDLDIVAGLTYNDEISWWENVAADASSWSKHIVALGPNFPSALAAGDIDGDGDLDLISGTYVEDDIAWWENGGGGLSWLMHLVDGGFDEPYAVGAADMDGDGSLDIYGAARAGDQITWWRNLDGDGLHWETHLVAEMYDQPRDVLAVDIDADDDMDLVGAATLLNQVTLVGEPERHRDHHGAPS